ncbi:hypothetical protein CLV56_3572 [Mumia flava]|uniref:Uncharacterized protein n=1 Tax=Mumia flava TaxID=1348852 RepID=A0A0B2BUR5_9ACTN|nr:hypothetical protein [Mumia flava]PJJ54068.1 hypothetical protein CLV56_3572 [Mumia flava]
MTGERPVDVPDSVTALYVVLTDEPLESDLPAPPVPPPSLLLARGSSPKAVAYAEGLVHAIAVTEEGPTADALGVHRRAQERARALAAEHVGAAVDVAVPRLVGGSVPHPDQVRATDWFVLEHPDDATTTTHGIARVGVPELVAAQVPPGQLPMYDAVLTGLAQRVLEEWPDHDPVGPATITLRDVARGYGDASAGGEDPTLARSIDVTLAYDEDADLLAVTLHDDPATALFA